MCIELQAQGAFKAGSAYADVTTSLTSVFSSSTSLLASNLQFRVPGAIATNLPPRTMGNTAFNTLPMDIPEDFAVPGPSTTVRVVVPAGAAYLFWSVPDSYFSDNSDPNSDYKLVVWSNVGPRANAGTDQRQMPGATVTLNGTASECAESFQWTQVAGPVVALSDSSSPSPTFAAPSPGGILTFELTVNRQGVSATDRVDITVGYPIDPRSSFWHTYQDRPELPRVISLASLGVGAGDKLRLTRLGGYFARISDLPAAAMVGVFTADTTLLAASAANRLPTQIPTDLAYQSGLTDIGKEPTDIPADFFVYGEGTVVTVPAGAAYLMIAVADSYFEDNRDPDNDFAVVVELFAPAGPSGPPQVAILSPEANALLGTSSVSLRVEVGHDFPTTIVSTPAGLEAQLPGSGIVEGVVPLEHEGDNDIMVTVSDGYGNVVSTMVVVVRDITPPSVTVSPASGAVFGMSPATLAVTVDDAHTVDVSFGGLAFGAVSPGASVSGPVGMIEGMNTIAINAVDLAGNATTVPYVALLDLTAPLVTISSPAVGACVGPAQATATLVATIDDASSTQISSLPATIAEQLPPGGGVAIGQVGLVEGANLLQVFATDETGRVGTASRLVTLDTTPPTVSIIAPSSGEAVAGAIEVAVEATDPSGGCGLATLALTLDGAELASGATASLLAPLNTATLTDGDHVLTAVAVDQAGNRRTVTTSFVVDNTPPTVAFVSPASGAFVRGQLAFAAAAADGGSGLSRVVFRVAGRAPTVDPSVRYETPKQGSVAFAGQEDTFLNPDGRLVIEATATDAAGNVATTSLQVEVDNTAPTRMIVSPSDGETVSGLIAIVADVVDPNFESAELFIDGTSMGSFSTAAFSVPYDTRGRLDGLIEISLVARDLAGNQATCTIHVALNNLTVMIQPQSIRLADKGCGVLTVQVEGTNVALLIPTEANQLELRVPGGAPVRATAGFGGDDHASDGDGDGVPDLIIKFDRQALASTIRAAIAAGKLNPAVPVAVELVARGSASLGSDVLRLKP